METEDPRQGAEVAAARLAVLEAVRLAIDRREELMNLIGAAQDAEQARRAIQSAFGLDEVQAHAVLDLQVRRFSERERLRIAEELESLRLSLNDEPTDL